MADENPNALQFDSMRVDREQYGANKGRLKANVRCTRYNTTLDVMLPEDTVAQMMRLIAPVVAQEVQTALTEVAHDHELLQLAKNSEPIEGEAEETA